MSIDIEKIKAAALAGNQAWMDEAYEIEPSAVLELIERLEAAERDAERYRWLKSGGKVVSIDHFKDHYRAVDVSVDLIMTDWLPSFDEAVDAGMEAMKEKP